YPYRFFIGAPTYTFYRLNISNTSIFFDHKLHIHPTFNAHPLSLSRIFEIFSYPLQEGCITPTLERRLFFDNCKDFFCYLFFWSLFKDDVFDYSFFCDLNVKVHLYLLLNFFFIRHLYNLWLLNHWRRRGRLLCWRNLHHILKIIINSSKIDKTPLVVELPFKCGYYHKKTDYEAYA